jgi:phage repressor protein C with HTH and peptisase S24 domain
MSTIHTRIAKRRAELGLSYEALGELLGVSWQTVQQWEKDTAPKRTRLADVAKALQTTPEYLLIGIETTLEPEFPRTPSEEEYALIPQYSTRASCGNGYLNDHVEVKGGLAFKREWLARFNLNEKNASVIYAHGDSMNPTIQDGDVLLIDQSPTQVRAGEVYAVMMDEEVVVKRLIKEFGITLLRSDNPNKSAYSDISVPPGHNLQVIGRVVWRGGGL